MKDSIITTKSANIFRWEMWGILFIVLFGAPLHFVFEWSGYWAPVGAIVPVNESVWEHLKLTYCPALIWTIIEYFKLRRSHRDNHPDFLLAKAIGAYVMPIVIVIIFYSYTAFTGHSILAVDLASFVIAVVVGQLVSYRLWRSLNLSHSYEWLGLALFITGVVLFAVFTFYPPHIGLFQDEPTGGYGIVTH